MERTDGYALLRDYSFLADGHGGALVAADGSIDWLAAPRFDAAPLCAALLDPAEGGAITLAPTVEHETEQRYVPGTMVVETVFRTADSEVRMTDALTRSPTGPLPWTELARRVEVTGKPVPMCWRIQLGHRLSTTRPWAEMRDDIPFMHAGHVQLAVVADGVGKPRVEDRTVAGEFTAREGDPALLALVASEGEPLTIPQPRAVHRRIDQTIDVWRGWCETIVYDGPYDDAVRRSALVLKGLTVAPTEGLMAALTTSLPEELGADRNYDYRFGWVRDASFALYSMARLDLAEEVQGALSWLLRAVRRTAPVVRPIYTVRGEVPDPEMTPLHWVPGYRKTSPVHVGNAASAQVQLGSYGDLMDAVWRYCSHHARLDEDNARTLSSIVDHVCDSWLAEDAGIWELPATAHYTISKIGCWVALDRAVRLAESGQLPSLHLDRWRDERDDIHAWVDEHCWSETKQSYTFYAGSDELDAAVLLAARTGFLAGDDPRLASTLDAVRTELGAGGPLLYRYSGMQGKEGAFLACTFWMIQAMAAVGRGDEADKLMREALAHAGQSGLFSEELDPETGELRGNFPQGLTHLALIGAAAAIEEAGKG